MRKPAGGEISSVKLMEEALASIISTRNDAGFSRKLKPRAEQELRKHVVSKKP